MVCDFVELDDTGATYLSLNSPNDFLALDLAPDDPLELVKIAVETANGIAARNLTGIMVNFKDADGYFMGPWKYMICILNPGDQTRLSGMYLRSNLHTAKAPDNTGRLYIASRKKNGVMAHFCQQFSPVFRSGCHPPCHPALPNLPTVLAHCRSSCSPPVSDWDSSLLHRVTALYYVFLRRRSER